jgi:hypothetical protein
MPTVGVRKLRNATLSNNVRSRYDGKRRAIKCKWCPKSRFYGKIHPYVTRPEPTLVKALLEAAANRQQDTFTPHYQDAMQNAVEVALLALATIRNRYPDVRIIDIHKNRLR